MIDTGSLYAAVSSTALVQSMVQSVTAMRSFAYSSTIVSQSRLPLIFGRRAVWIASAFRILGRTFLAVIVMFWFFLL